MVCYNLKHRSDECPDCRPHHANRKRTEGLCPVCVFETFEIPIIPDVLVKTLLTTNNPIDNTNSPSFWSSLETERTVFSDLKAQIAKVQDLLTRMNNAKATVALTIKQHEAVLHPMRALPNDILLAIFEWCTFTEDSSPYCDFWSPRRAPWSLSRVSQRWRMLTLASPCLWLDIVIHNTVSNTRQKAGIPSKLDLLLRRSGGLELFLDLTIGQEDIAFTSHIYRVLAPTTSRWRSLKLTDDVVFPWLTGCSFDRLTELELHCRYWYQGSHSSVFPVFADAHNLRHLKLMGWGDNLEVPWNRITSYSCDIEGIHHLPKFTALEHLSVCLDSSLRTWPFGSGVPIPFTLPMLRSISIKHIGLPVRFIQEVSDMMLSPSLATLAIEFPYESPNFPPLPTFLGSVHCLQNFSLYSYTMGRWPEISLFLTQNSSITALYIVEADVLDLLRVVENEHVRLPNLTSLRIDVLMLRRSATQTIDALHSRICDETGVVAKISELRIVGDEKEIGRVPKWVSKKKVSEVTLAKWTAIHERVNVVIVRKSIF